MPKVQCILGPNDGGYLEFPGSIPNIFRIPSNVKKPITDPVSRQSLLDNYYMAEYRYDKEKGKYIFNDYV